MSGKLHRCLRVWIAVTAAAILGGLLFPGSAIVRQALAKLSEFENGSTPLEITGSGTHDAPWQLRTRATPSQSAPRPAMVELHDDVDGLFQSSPHAPIDYAVILRNLWRLGAKHVCCAPLLAWSEPDPIGLAAMESTMAKFKSVVLAAPLTRGPTMEPLPSAFRRASLPLTKIKGNVSLLPVVNRVALPNMVYGKDNTLAGFQVLDSEPSTPTIPLLARWDDRVVCSFHLLAAMQRAQTRIDELEVHVGKAIQLGNKGPRIPIDDYGHL